MTDAAPSIATYVQYIPIFDDAANDPGVRRAIIDMARKKMHVEIAEKCMRVAVIEYQTMHQWRYLPDDPEQASEYGWTDEARIPPSQLLEQREDKHWIRREVIVMRAQCVPCDTVAVIADDVTAAVEYANDRWKGHDVRVIALTDRVSVSRLYGHQGLPCSMVPGTEKLVWHRELPYHERCGRIVFVAETATS